MSSKSMLVGLLPAAWLLTLAGCGAPGLPPAGPEAGEVDVGYGTQPKEDVTGAITSVSDAELDGSQSANIEDLLRGRAAGLQIIPRPEGGYFYRIRGLSSTQGEQPEPLFVVDGQQISASDVESALVGLTRADIRQIDVLKDVASTSIYGIRGAGGVVVITTTR
ncbi:MAG: TonB-dependent receptor plug domain-containing protein, partial [Longimicrobiales bacterium]